MPEYRDDARQQTLLEGYERALLTDSAAPRPPDLDPTLAVAAEVLARQLGGPFPAPAAPDPAFRAALRARLAGRAGVELRSPNGVAHPDARESAASIGSARRSARREGHSPDGAGRDKIATLTQLTLPPVSSLAPPGPPMSGHWRGVWATVAGGLGRAGTALLLVAIVAVAVALLRPAPLGPGGRGGSPGVPSATVPATPDAGLVTAMRALQPRVGFPLSIPSDTRGFAVSPSAIGSPDPTVIAIFMAETGGAGRVRLAQAATEPGATFALADAGAPSLVPVRGVAATLETGRGAGGADAIRLRWGEGGVFFLLEGEGVPLSRLVAIAESVTPLMALPGASATPGRPATAPRATIAPTQAVAPPRWQATGALSAPRADHTATRLADGRILVAGGHINGAGEGVAASAELYDPQTGGWSLTGTMGVARFGHRAVLLADGRVLVIGGLNYRQFSNTTAAGGAELYDPASGRWSPTAPLPLAFTPTALIRLTDGRALALSNPDGTAGNKMTATIYDPIADRWSLAGNPDLPNVAAAVALRDGSVIALGEVGEAGDDSTPAARYDPASGSWAAIAPLPGARSGATLSVLPDGRVLVAGGVSIRRGSDGVTTATLLGSTVIYDPVARSWIEGAGLTTPRSGQEATTLSDGRILIVGGNANGGQGPISAELYDPQSGTWTALGEVGGKMRRAFAVAPLAAGRALIIGGDAGFVRSEWLAEVQLLTPPAAPRVTTRSGSGGAIPGATPGTGSGIGKWDVPNAGLLFFGGRGYRVREQTLPDGTAPQVGAQIGATLLPVQSGGVLPAGVPIYAVTGQSPESWLTIRDGARTVLYRQDDSATALLAGFQVVIATSASDGKTVCPSYGCPSGPIQGQPGTIATANRVVVERAIQGSVAAGTTIEVRQMGLPGAGLPNDRVVALPPGQRVILFLQPAQRQSFGDFAGGDYYWTGPGWAYGFVNDQVVPLGGSGGVQTPLDRFEAAIRDLFAAVTPRAPTDPVPTPRPVPTPTGIVPAPTAPRPATNAAPTPTPGP